MDNINTLKLKDLKKCEISNVLACLPVGTSLVPASFWEEDAEGWVIMPPDSAVKSQEAFDVWKDEIYNAAIDLGKKQSTLKETS